MHGPLCDPLCPLWFVFVPRLALAVFAVKRSFVAFLSSFGQLDLLRVTGGGAILSWHLLHHCRFLIHGIERITESVRIDVHVTLEWAINRRNRDQHQ